MVYSSLLSPLSLCLSLQSWSTSTCITPSMMHHALYKDLHTSATGDDQPRFFPLTFEAGLHNLVLTKSLLIS